jgi:hypothetical protein
VPDPARAARPCGDGRALARPRRRRSAVGTAGERVGAAAARAGVRGQGDRHARAGCTRIAGKRHVHGVLRAFEMRAPCCTRGRANHAVAHARTPHVHAQDLQAANSTLSSELQRAYAGCDEVRGASSHARGVCSPQITHHPKPRKRSPSCPSWPPPRSGARCGAQRCAAPRGAARDAAGQAGE